MVKDQLIDSHVSEKQAKLAINALYNHAKKRQQEKEEKELLPGKETHVWLVVAVKRIYAERKLKPFRIPLKHTIVDPRESNVCLITKDPQREYKDLLEQHKIKFISRVVGINKLKGKWKPFEARRLLMKENDMFLADERVVPLLPGLLGKIFFEAKKQPIPVDLTKKDLRTELENAINSSYMHQNQGTCTSIKLATLKHTPDQIFDNIQTAIPAIISRITDGWENIQSLHIKTSTSTSLPIWTCHLGDDAGGRWDLPATEKEKAAKKAAKRSAAAAKKEEGGGEDEEWGGIGADGLDAAGSEPKAKKRKVEVPVEEDDEDEEDESYEDDDGDDSEDEDEDEGDEDDNGDEEAEAEPPLKLKTKKGLADSKEEKPSKSVSFAPKKPTAVPSKPALPTGKPSKDAKASKNKDKAHSSSILKPPSEGSAPSKADKKVLAGRDKATKAIKDTRSAKPKAKDSILGKKGLRR